MEENLLKKIKAHKKYNTLSDDIIKKELTYFLKIKPNAKDKEIVKEVRKKLHRLYASYQINKKKKRKNYLEKLKQGEIVLDELLAMTLSTKERKDDYKNIYHTIFSYTKKPKIVIDIGCGMNPLSFPLMDLEKVKYYCYDIDAADVAFLNTYFQLMKNKGLEGKAFLLDAKDETAIKKIPKSDIVFMFKLIDLLDSDKNISEKIIEVLLNKTSFVVASFATKTLTQKPMKLTQRRGFQKMLDRKNLHYKQFNTTNELFYIIHKSPNLLQ